MVGFAPWIIFWIVASGPSNWLFGAIAAAIAAIILAVPDMYRRRPKILDYGTIAFFVALIVAGITLSAKDGDWLDRYSNPISTGVLAVIALGSLLFVPFTEQYARETTPREYWDTPLFKKINRVLTFMWGVVFVISAVCGLIAIWAPSTRDWTSWVIPIVLLVGAIKFTSRYPDTAK
ncbi:hypothetical protein GCM10007298_13260 [Williamsia phyllosphaerae]|uniref:Intracellular septation protein A n=1 Tax=Williamsia phyllosphaerae TaxID=885042 RepID=A0ABQ1UKA8_9NOCA|nr:hypothetical protein GCM10007298_13260 [Williamsia phyllosphaerae]